MSVKTTHTTTISVPVYVSWRCEECGEINFSQGDIICQCSESSYALSQSKQDEAKELANKRAHLLWLPLAYGTIKEPLEYLSTNPNILQLKNKKCTQCRKKPRWSKDSIFTGMSIGAGVSALFFGIKAIISPTNVTWWICLGISIAALFFMLSKEKESTHKTANLMSRYAPVIGTLNPELIEYAAQHGERLPSPEQCVEIVKKGNIKEEKKNQSRFCRKCGEVLWQDSDFCHQCGTKVIK